MTRPVVTKDDMLRRTALFKDLKPSTLPFLDAAMPEFERQIFNVIGGGVTEDANAAVAIADARDFHLTMVRAGPGKGSALHTHTTLEVFVPLSGTWAIIWGDEGENELTIGPWDVVSVPTEIMRGFRNDSDADAVLLAILGGTDPGRVTWAESIVEAARSRGVTLDADGNVVRGKGGS